ncbi:MAG: hypothetical protein J6B53_16000 [Clostridia bacterium]|jgi:hypothetical protein|nr:hypothetical protein [Clostridia bacterium]
MKFGENYIQFSKIMVLIVLIAVTLLAVLGLVGMVLAEEYEQLPGLFTHYTDFASVVFVAYSGNSVAEKWLVAGHPKEKREGESSG